jgi:hypothetical protein
MLRAAWALPVAMAAGGCTLAEVVVPESRDVLVVEAVLRTDQIQQTIVLHRSVRDGTSLPEPHATVAVAGPNGAYVTFFRAESCPIGNLPAAGSHGARLGVGATCYYSHPYRGRWVLPGATYELEVFVGPDQRIGGRTTVPGAFSLLGVPYEDGVDEPPPCRLAPDSGFELRWTRSTGAWGYIAPLVIHGLSSIAPPGVDAPEPLELTGVAVSAADTSIMLPAEFGVFDRFGGNQELLRLLQRGLPEGTTATVTVAAADRNYINGVRGGSFNPSGQVRISSVTGDGVGVFGSLVPLRAAVEVGPAGDGRAPCGAG